jgi:Ca2+-binding EF-hand superfamily protein
VRDHFSKAIVERFTSGEGLQRMLMQLDEDRDGKLQMEEVPPRMSGPIFGILDVDRDGGLDTQELQKASELLRGLRGGSLGNRP